MEKKIAVLAGDGIGPEVMLSAQYVLNVIAQKYGHKFNFVEGLIGGAAYDINGQHLPKQTLDLVPTVMRFCLARLAARWINRSNLGVDN